MSNELRTGRVEALCDGIFAIAMTLLIVSFTEMINWPASINEAELRKLLFDMVPDLVYYVQSFIILGAFWIEHHHQFHYIRHTDLKLLFINIFAFMFVALIPFSTMIVGDYGHTRIAAVLFEVNLLCAGIFFYIQWAYAVRKPGMTDPALDGNTIKFYSRKNLVVPVISVVAIAVSFIKPQIGSLIYFAAPFIIILQKSKQSLRA